MTDAGSRDVADEAQAQPRPPGPQADLKAWVAWWRNGALAGYPAEWLQQAAGCFLGLDAPLLAYDVATTGLRQQPGDFVLRRWQALALARSGSARRAQAILHELSRERPGDEETRGMLARTHKDLALCADSPAERNEALRRAFDIYHDGYRARQQNYWLGINAASIAALRADLPAARSIAASVFRMCREMIGEQAGGGAADYWLPATLGEAALISGQIDEAARWYADAVRMAHGHRGSIASMRRNATLLLGPESSLPLTCEQRARIMACFPRPQIVVFAGHMIDGPGRPRARFPAALAPEVYRRIRAALEPFGAGVIGYGSAACGSDILFLEAVLGAGGEAHVVLPYDRDDFARDSVDFGGAGWRERFERVLDDAAQLLTASPRQRLSLGGASCAYANDVLTGLAMAHARRVDGALHALAVWDGERGDGPGGTASIVARWRARQLEPVVIDPGEIAGNRRDAAARDAGPPAPGPLSPHHGMEVRAIMFLDVVKFSELAEEQMPVFVERFLEKLGELASVAPPQGPLVKESRGDGVYFVFENVRCAGRFALQVNQVLEETAWGSIGLPEDFAVRISLHAGPVYAYTCPFLGRATYTGNHVNLAARIEQSTPVGQVYASQQFAALACEEGVTEFQCDYAGPVTLAKNYGTFPLYHVAPAPGQKRSARATHGSGAP